MYRIGCGCYVEKIEWMWQRDNDEHGDPRNYRNPEWHYLYKCNACKESYIWHKGQGCNKYSVFYEFIKRCL